MSKVIINKVLKTDIIYSDLKLVLDGEYEIAIEINGIDLIDLPVDQAIDILNANGLIKEQLILIPAGSILDSEEYFGGACEYSFNNGLIKADMYIEDINQSL
ncbi:MAG: hypothetical protein WC679_02450 [Bacteroidales bacterium]|jgi:hypothetical protein